MYVFKLQNTANNACNEKWDWIEHTPDATTSAFIQQMAALDEALAPIWQKLSEPGIPLFLWLDSYNSIFDQNKRCYNYILCHATKLE